MADRPNIVFITTDQHRGDTLGSAGHPCVRTPHLDKLAQMGVRFDRAYSDCPVCIPARTTMVTGVQAHRYGMPSYNDKFRIDRPREQFLGSLLTQAGYQTQIMGKTHWHTEQTFRAGFEHIVWEHQYNDWAKQQNGNRRVDQSGIGMNEPFADYNHLPPEWTMTNWLVDHCVEFLHYRDQTQPFFLWLSVIDPHPPMTIHEPYYSMYDDEDIPEPVVPEWIYDDACPYDLRRHREVWNSVRMKPMALRKSRGVYYGMITHIDHQIGRLLGSLNATKSLHNTWIVFASDHGEMLGDMDDMGKSTFLEPSTHVPLIICPPAHMKVERGKVIDSLVGLDDLLPTFCSISGAEMPSDITGHNLLPLVYGTKERVREHYHGQIDSSHMFHTGKYKYMYCVEDGKELLFDAINDRQERNPILDQPELLADIRAQFIAHLQAENHEHLQHGSLVNMEIKQQTDQQLRAHNVYGWV